MVPFLFPALLLMFKSLPYSIFPSSSVSFFCPLETSSGNFDGLEVKKDGRKGDTGMGEACPAAVHQSLVTVETGDRVIAGFIPKLPSVIGFSFWVTAFCLVGQIELDVNKCACCRSCHISISMQLLAIFFLCTASAYTVVYNLAAHGHQRPPCHDICALKERVDPVHFSDRWQCVVECRKVSYGTGRYDWVELWADSESALAALAMAKIERTGDNLDVTLYDVCVDPNMRRIGIATSLLLRFHAALIECYGSGGDAVKFTAAVDAHSTSRDAAIGLYNKLGYTSQDQDDENMNLLFRWHARL